MTSRAVEADERTRLQPKVAGGVFTDPIVDIELGFQRDDPDLVRPVRQLPRAEVANAYTVFVLLVVSAVLLTVGLATRSLVPWVAGGHAFLATFGVDGRHQRRLWREAVALRRRNC